MENIIVLDTETAGAIHPQLLDLGYKIIAIDEQTAEYTVKVARSYLNRALYNNRIFLENDNFVRPEKLAIYDRLVEEGKITLRSLPQMLTTLANDIARFDVHAVYMYNANFDRDKIEKASAENGIINPLADVDIYDIWAFSTNFITNTDDFREWALENEMLTATQRFISTSVETVARYLYQNLEFKEQHTALDDVGHEITILCECLRRGAFLKCRYQRKSYIESGKVFTKSMVMPGGEYVEFEYQKMRTKDGTEIYQ